VRAAVLAAAALVVVAASERAAADDDLRVRICAGQRDVVISGRGLRVDGRAASVDVLRASAVDGRVHIGSRTFGSSAVVSGSGVLRVDGRSLEGSLRIAARGAHVLDVVNAVSLEPYVASAVASETPAGWPLEALKAQAVVARTYALHERARRGDEDFDLEASVISQRYGADPVAESVADATRATVGEYLAYAGEPILAAFHASAGGATASAEEVWGQPVPYLQSVSSPDDGAPDFFWSYAIPLADLAAALREAGYAAGDLGEVQVTDRSDSGRVERIRLGAVLLSGRDLREILGGRALRSALFDARIEGSRVVFLGSGSGHGVGLCQWGASELARRGSSYRAILSHYYSGSDLRRLGGRDSRPTDWSARR
jgi:stage II sporulation protein D (peptidoglycan lytic transglycosylase)